MVEHGCPVEVTSVLRLRPLLNKEREDHVLLRQQRNVGKNAPPTVVLNPPPGGDLASSSFVSGSDSNRTQEYHFNHVLPADTSQDKIYFKLGLPIATSAMDSLKLAVSSSLRNTSNSHLLICLGVINSGKTHTCFGGNTVSKRRTSQEGLVPRLVDSLFSQSRHHAKGVSKQFSVQISAMQVSQAKGKDSSACTIQDLLASPPKDKGVTPPKRNKSVLSMVANFERTVLPSPRMKLSGGEVKELDVDNCKPTVKSCGDITEAREILQAGLAASRKAAKGQLNNHLLITIQPVFDGEYLGDKIAVLDMAGLEKGKRSQNRGKDSVPSGNQAASGAVLHCLRTLIHNTHVRSGKSGALDIMCSDDDDLASEISCVSQAKNQSYRSGLKPVPFRRHQLTMAMRPLFLSSSHTNVTLLLTAYPGHTDYSEKKLLLQDLELLCGATLNSSNAVVETGLEEEDGVEAEEEEEDDGSEPYASATSDDESLDQDRVPLSPRRVLNFDRRPDIGKNSSWDLPTPTAPTDDDCDCEDKVSLPPPFAPTSRREPPKAYSRWLARPSAPSEDIVRPQVKEDAEESRVNKTSVVSDFPGVTLPSKTIETSPIVERLKASTVMPASREGGRKVKAPPSPDEMSWVSQKEGICFTSSKPRDGKRPLQPSTSVNVESTEKKFSRKSPIEARSEKKHVKTTSVADYGQIHTPVEKTHVSSRNKGLRQQLKSTALPPRKLSDDIEERGPVVARLVDRKDPSETPMKTTQRKLDDHDENRERKRRENPVNIDRGRHYSNVERAKETEDSEGLSRKVRDLETKLREVMKQKAQLEKRCTALEKENQDLKACTREAGRKRMQSQWTEQEEQEWQQSRRMRLEDQKIIKQPLMEHFEKVNNVYDIKNQWCMSNKPHFGLSFPCSFQRATDLDLRDKAREEQELEPAQGHQDGLRSNEDGRKPTCSIRLFHDK